MRNATTTEGSISGALERNADVQMCVQVNVIVRVGWSCSSWVDGVCWLGVFAVETGNTALWVHRGTDGPTVDTTEEAVSDRDRSPVVKGLAMRGDQGECDLAPCREACDTSVFLRCDHLSHATT